MSFLGGLFGLSTPAQPEKQESSASADLFGATSFRSTVSPSSPSSEFVADGATQASPQQPAQAPAAPSAPAPEAPSSLAMLKGAYDPAALHPMAGLGDNLDFLALEEDKLTDIDGAATVLPSRGWTDDLCVGAGTTYLSGEWEFAR
jgi:import inner membrane translocase subunit TIM23